jgi:ferrous iron transport protein A
MIKSALSLSDIDILTKVRVISLGNQDIASRLYCMGVLPGSIIQLIRKQPWNGSLYIRVNNTSLAMRASEAKSIMVEKIE